MTRFEREDTNLKIPMRNDVSMIPRFPGRIPVNSRITALQSLIDLAPTFLTVAGLPVPGDMHGVNQLPVWVENRYQPTKVHIRAYIGERYKLTVYRGEKFGELFDLLKDPEERKNLFDDPAYRDVKAEVLQQFVDAELRREVSKYARIAFA